MCSLNKLDSFRCRILPMGYIICNCTRPHTMSVSVINSCSWHMMETVPFVTVSQFHASSYFILMDMVHMPINFNITFVLATPFSLLMVG